MKRHDITCICRPCMRLANKAGKPKRKAKRNANATKRNCRHVEFTRFTVVVELPTTMVKRKRHARLVVKRNYETRNYVRCNRCGSQRRIV